MMLCPSPWGQPTMDWNYEQDKPFLPCCLCQVFGHSVLRWCHACTNAVPAFLSTCVVHNASWWQ
jgi:hypothetical protein